MYYSSGNYEAFAHPKKPEGVDNKSAYLIGSGLAALTAACYLVRDGQMQGNHIHVFEKDPLPGGACDGYKYDIGYVMRGGREMDNHFEVMWDLLRSIPSLETEGASVLDEYYWLNKEDPNKSLCRATVNRGQDAHTDGKFAISDQGAMELSRLKKSITSLLLSDVLAVNDPVNAKVQKELAEVLALGEPTTTALTEKPNLSPAVKPTTAVTKTPTRAVTKTARKRK